MSAFIPKQKHLLVVSLVVAFFALVGGALASSSSSWKVIGHASASGEFAIAAANGTARHPNGLAARVAGGGGSVSGFAVVACSRGIASIGSSTTKFSGHFANLKMPMKNSDSCDVTASASGAGHLRLEILSR
jgi:hypothetical protein